MSRSSSPAEADRAALEAIREGFRRYFDAFGLKLPQPIPLRGVVDGEGWHIAYLLDVSDPKHPFLDFFAENRHTNSRHVRIQHDSESVMLENYQDAFFLDEGDSDWGRAVAERDAQNRKVTEILQKKGLLSS
jgi:hypothetical protein